MPSLAYGALVRDLVTRNCERAKTKFCLRQVLQALYFVPQVRFAVANLRLPEIDPQGSLGDPGKALNYWSVSVYTDSLILIKTVRCGISLNFMRTWIWLSLLPLLTLSFFLLWESAQ